MILAAGRGERMRPLTDRIPKSLLEVGGRPLIFRHLEKLADAGFGTVVINHAHLGEQIEAAVGDGSRWNLAVRFSPEEQALETAGGIRNALPLLREPVFAVVNADVYSKYEYSCLAKANGHL
jgi:MurNAc alpha-1-phosphate uridylyltransferase